MSGNKVVLGTDLMLAETSLGPDLFISSSGDLEPISEEMNLAQSILHRIRTYKGELADIGHPDYGSTLYDVVGEPNNEMTRARIKMIVRDTLLQEPRVKEIVSILVKSRRPTLDYKEEKRKTRMELAKVGIGEIEVSSFSDYLHSVEIDVTIIPIGGNVPLNLVFPFYLEVV